MCVLIPLPPAAARTAHLACLQTRQLLKASCLGFDNPEILAGLPFKTLHDDRTNAGEGCPGGHGTTAPGWRGPCTAPHSARGRANIASSVPADAVVGWDNSTRTAYIFWKYTEEKRDWLTDAAGIQASCLAAGFS